MIINELDITNPISLKEFLFPEILICIRKLGKNGLIDIICESETHSLEINEGKFFVPKNEDPYKFFSIADGTVNFRVNQTIVASSGDKILIDILNILFRGIKEFCEVERVRKRSPLSNHQYMLLDRDFLPAISDLPIKGGEKGLLSLTQDCNKISEIYNLSFLGRDIIDKVLFFLYLAEVIKVGDDLNELREEVDKKRTFNAAELKEREDVIDFYLKISGFNYYEILGLGTSDDELTVTASYKRLKRYYSSQKLLDLFKYENRNILLIVNNYLDKAHSILSLKIKRKEYDLFLNSKRDGDFQKDSPFMKAEEEIKKSDNFLNGGDFKNAIDCIKTAIKGNPLNAFYYIKYGRALSLYSRRVKSSEYNDSIAKCYLKALEIDKMNTDALYEISTLYKENGDIERAKKYIINLLTIKPQHDLGVKFVEENFASQSFEILLNILFQNIDKLSNHEILGLDKKTPLTEIKDKYLLLAKKYHPDRFYGSSDPELKEKTVKVFKKIAKAYKEIKDELEGNLPKDEKRDEKKVNPNVKKFYELGLLALKHGNTSSAMINFKLALKIDPNNEEIGELVDRIEKGKI